MAISLRPAKRTCPKCGSPVDVTHQKSNLGTHRIGDVGDMTTETATCTNEECDYRENTTAN